MEPWHIPQAAHLAAGGDVSVHTRLRTQAGRSLEQAPGLNTLLSEVNTNAWGSVQLLCGWKEGRAYYESRSSHQWDVESCRSSLPHPTANPSSEPLPQLHRSDFNQIQLEISLFFKQFSDE